MADKISLEDLLQVVKVLGKDEDPKEDPKPKTEEEIREEILAELKAEQEAEKEKKTKEDQDEDEDEDLTEEPKSDSREDKHIARTIKAGLKGASLDSGVVESVLEFIDYGTLKNEEGEADDDKLESFVELILHDLSWHRMTSVALPLSIDAGKLS